MICSAIVRDLMMELSACIGYCGAFFLSIVKNFDNPLVPCKIIFLAYNTYSLAFVKYAMKPVSHS